MRLGELLRAASLSGASVAYTVSGPGVRGRVALRTGKVVEANATIEGSPALNGRPALDALLARSAELTVEPAPVRTSRPPAKPPKTVPPPPPPPTSAASSAPAKKEPPSVSTNANPFQEISEQMRSSAPGSVAAGIFSIEDGLMLGVHSSVPDTNVDAMSGSHVRIVDQIMKFAELLPERIRGKLHSVVLELEETSFFMTMDDDHRVAIMLAGDHVKGNLGYIRLVAKRQVKKTIAVLDGI